MASGRRGLRWTKRALRRIDDIGQTIAIENPSASAIVVQRIISVVYGLEEHPFRGRPGRVVGTRELVVPGLPYIIAYRVTDQHISILTVLHAARRWPRRL
ncbi:type II toxin-antitoxin system RelE/ParE family toxin [Allorhizobium pseudoryzae]|uniref:type II toxin-antitoxin system RelE/ParE family toxin n=1 Tax=Allorhizobium pseudoryzae TaxID=379684 RepID=UPI0013EA6E8C|nr:type II toxin-antitoxin system RelE/ParE family toxin [Allorhizobium pseudoryzae]